MNKLRGILDIPTYYKNLFLDISSESIHSLLEAEPLEYMRALFIDDNRLFYNLRDELILRGIGFKKDVQNNYLLGRDYHIHLIINKTENTNAYKDINFAMHGAANFIDRFQVNSDLFFHNIPWEGILHFIPSSSPDILKEIFLKAGFSFVSVEEYQAIPPVNLDSSYSASVSGNSIIEEPINYSKLDLPIEHYFEEAVFRHFITYCQINKIKKISDLTLDNIEDYSNQKFTRKKTIQLVEKKYYEINKRFNPLQYEFQEALDLLLDNRLKKICEIADADYLGLLNTFYENENIYDDRFHLDEIEEFCVYMNGNLEEIVKEKAERKKREQFSSLTKEISNHPKYKYVLSTSIQELVKLFSLNNIELPNEEVYLYVILDDSNYISLLEKILNRLNSLAGLKETVQRAIENLDERALEVIELRESMTLQEIGGVFGVSRERVRQIETKANQTLMRYGNQSKIEIYFKFYTEHSKLISIDSFCDANDISGTLEKVIVKNFLSHSKSIHYINSIQRYMNVDDYVSIIDSLEKVDLSQSIIEVSYLRQIIPKEVIDEMQEVIDMIIRSYGYSRVNDIYAKEKISIINRINYLFEKHISEPLQMDDEGYEYFRNMMTSVFCIPFESTKRSATARIADGKNVILVDRNTFFRHEEEKITDVFLNSLEKIIDDTLNTHPYADPRIIYNENPNMVESASLHSPVHLYSIIQLYLGDKYETGHRNTLNIYKTNTTKIDSESILLNHLSKNGHEVPYHKVLEDLNWKVPKLDQLLARIDSAITVKERKIKSIESFEFTDAELNELSSTIQQELEKGYLFTEDLAFKLAFNSKLEGVVKRTGLSDITTLSSIVKWLFKDVSGYPRMLYKATSTIKSLEQVLVKEFPEKMSRADMINFTKEKGYSEQKMAAVSSTIVNEELFYPYTSAQYINGNIVNFQDDTRKSLQVYLDKQFANKPYKSMFSLIGYSQELLPISQYTWTEWLIHHFSEQVGYRKLIVHNQDYRYDKLLLVKEDSNIYTLEELIYYIAKTEYKERTHEEDFAKYLAADNIINNPRRLSHEIYNSKYFEFDHFGFFKLR